MIHFLKYCVVLTIIFAATFHSNSNCIAVVGDLKSDPSMYNTVYKQQSRKAFMYMFNFKAWELFWQNMETICKFIALESFQKMREVILHGWNPGSTEVYGSFATDYNRNKTHFPPCLSIRKHSEKKKRFKSQTN